MTEIQLCLLLLVLAVFCYWFHRVFYGFAIQHRNLIPFVTLCTASAIMLVLMALAIAGLVVLSWQGFWYAM